MRQQDPDFTLCISRRLLYQLFVAAAIIILLFVAGHILLVAFGGVLLATLLRGISKYAQKLRFINERWSYTAVLGTVLIVALVLGYLLGPRVLTQAHEIAKAIPRSMASMRSHLETSTWGRDLVRLVRRTMEQERSGKALSYAAAVGELLTDVIVIIVIGIFIGASPQFYRNGVLLLLPDRSRGQAADLLDDIAHTLRSWLMGQMIPMTVLGVGSLIGLWLLRIPLAFTLALFTAAMLFIPYAGAVGAYLATALVAFAKGPTSLLYVTCLYLGIHASEAYVITPLAQRHAVRLPPAITIISQLLLWKLAGILGVFVATPLAAVCVVVVQRLYLRRKAPPEELTASS